MATPAPKSNYLIFDWTPPCSSNLGTPCKISNESVLPNPENATVSYLSTTLLIMWYKNTTGLCVAFQQYKQVVTIKDTTFTTSSVQSNTSYTSTTIACTNSIATLTKTQTSTQCSNDQNTTHTIYTTTYNQCS